jgi:hypothetical protein
MRVANGAMPLVRTVLGNSPEPQIMNEPKSPERTRHFCTVFLNLRNERSEHSEGR